MHSHLMRSIVVIVLTMGLCGVAAPVSADPRAKQDIAFDAPSTIALAESPFTLTATATSGLPVEYRSKTPSVCSIEGSSLVLARVGACKVTASQPGDATYMAAKAVTRSFEVTTASQVITFDPAASLLMTDSPYPLTATSSSGLPVSLVARPDSVCVLEGGQLMLRGSGSCDVIATQAGDWRYEPAEPVAKTIAVSLAEQLITFEPPEAVVMTESPVALVASASSGLPVSLEAEPSDICTLDRTTLTLFGSGPCEVTATQTGDWRYEPAMPVTRTIAVSLASQSITIEPPEAVLMTQSPVALAASASSGLPVSLGAEPSDVCTIDVTTLTLVGPGSCVVTATQVGDATYAAATPVTRSLRVDRATQTITFEPASSVAMADSPIALSASASSGLPVTFEATPDSVCAMDGANIVLHGTGTCEVTARQAGDERYDAAAPVTKSVAVLSGDADADAPVVSEVVVDPASVAAGGSVTITWRAADAAGVQGTSATVTLPGGQSFLQCGTSTMVSGTLADGQWSQTCPILAAAPNGLYSVWIMANDAVGNRRSQQFTGTGWVYDATFTVTS